MLIFYCMCKLSSCTVSVDLLPSQDSTRIRAVYTCWVLFIDLPLSALLAKVSLMMGWP